MTPASPSWIALLQDVLVRALTSKVVFRRLVTLVLVTGHRGRSSARRGAALREQGHRLVVRRGRRQRPGPPRGRPPKAKLTTFVHNTVADGELG